MTGEMSRSERVELAKVVRLRARVAKDDVGVREAQLLADVEQQLAARYKATHEAWAEVTAAAKAAVGAADAEVARRCRELGIPEEFRPSLGLSWYGRGENADKNRRAELRKVAQTQAAASGKAARLEIDRQAARLLTDLAAGALESSSAREFLAAMPTPEELMPLLALPELGGAQ